LIWHYRNTIRQLATVRSSTHGRIKKCFTRDTAIRYLAFFMTTEAFERSGFPQLTRGCVLIAMI
jgi:hypothetical protein